MYIKLWLRERKTKGEPISEPCESLTWFALSTAQTCLISAFFEDYYTEKTKHVAKCVCVCACMCLRLQIHLHFLTMNQCCRVLGTLRNKKQLYHHICKYTHYFLDLNVIYSDFKKNLLLVYIHFHLSAVSMISVYL